MFICAYAYTYIFYIFSKKIELYWILEMLIEVIDWILKQIYLTKLCGKDSYMCVKDYRIIDFRLQIL